MPESQSLLLLPGDGIGPEVMAEVEKIIDYFCDHEGLLIDTVGGLIGGASIDAHGKPLTSAVLAEAGRADAVLLGAVGGPQWDDVDFTIRPEAGLLEIRKGLKLFANLRPAVVFDALIDASSLKPEVIRGLDIMIIRELTGGLYFAKPRGIEDLGDGVRRGYNTQSYTSTEIRRIARIGFEMARQRKKRLTSVDKANVLESGRLWREEVTRLGRSDYPDVALDHIYVDNCAMQLLRHPHQFDVLLCDNMFGDILSDEAAMLTGSLGMLPSASLGAIEPETNKRRALYEPVHGSAPDIAGQGKANPLAMILSFALCLRYSLGHARHAARLEAAVQNVLKQGLRTADIAGTNTKTISTTEMGDAVIRALQS